MAERTPALTKGGIYFVRHGNNKYYAHHGGEVWELERRTANVLDGTHDTGWYLYGPGHFGRWCSRLISDAVDEAVQVIKS